MQIKECYLIFCDLNEDKTKPNIMVKYGLSWFFMQCIIKYRLKDKFKHCYILAKIGDFYTLRFDFSVYGLKMQYYNLSITDIVKDAQKRNDVGGILKMRINKRNSKILKPVNNCVSFMMHIMRINEKVHTPYQLYYSLQNSKEYGNIIVIK
jgi:hypothetical protein